MTAARIRGSQRIRSNSENDVDRLEGLCAVIACQSCAITGMLACDIPL